MTLFWKIPTTALPVAIACLAGAAAATSMPAALEASALPVQQVDYRGGPKGEWIPDYGYPYRYDYGYGYGYGSDYGYGYGYNYGPGFYTPGYAPGPYQYGYYGRGMRYCGPGMPYPCR
jgi:hypothetical protein